MVCSWLWSLEKGRYVLTGQWACTWTAVVMLAPCLHSLVHLKHQAVEQSVGHGRKEPAALVALRQQELWGLENKDGQLMNWVESFLFIYFFIFIFWCSGSLLFVLERFGLIQAGLAFGLEEGLAALPRGNLRWSSPKSPVPALTALSRLVWLRALWELLRGGKLHSSLASPFPRLVKEPEQVPSSNCVKKEIWKAGTQLFFFFRKQIPSRREKTSVSCPVAVEWVSSAFPLACFLLFCIPSLHILFRVLSAPQAIIAPIFPPIPIFPPVSCFSNIFPLTSPECRFM